MSKLFSFRYNSSSLRFGLNNSLAIPKHNVCTHENNHQITCHERWPTGEVLFRRLFGDSLVSKNRGAEGV